MKILFISALSVLMHLVRSLTVPCCEITLRESQQGNNVFQCSGSCGSSPKWYKNGGLVESTELEEATIQGDRVVFNTGINNLTHEANWKCSKSDDSVSSKSIPYFVPPSANDINETLTKDDESYIQTPSVIHLGDLSRRYLNFTVDVFHLPDCDPSVFTRVLTGRYQPGGMQVISNDEVSLDLGNFSIRYKVPENTSRLCLRCQIEDFDDDFESQSEKFRMIASDITIDIAPPTIPTSIGIITATVQYDEMKQRHYSVEFPNPDCKKADVRVQFLI